MAFASRIVFPRVLQPGHNSGPVTSQSMKRSRESRKVGLLWLFLRAFRQTFKCETPRRRRQDVGAAVKVHFAP